MNVFNTKRINMKLQQRLLRTEVTCLLLTDSHVISGMGGFISVFNIFSSQLVTQICIFTDNKVHGICKGTEKYFIVFGGRRIAIVTTVPDDIWEIKILWNVGDWILCAQWLWNDNIAIATAHNAVILWNWKKKETMVSYCEEKCILYSASFVGLNWEQLVVLAGTVFREVIIWSPADSKNSDIHSPVLQRLCGHKGVIFSIDYNPATGRIHTTSDDRSVKGWQVSPPQPHDWKLAKIQLIYTTHGHSARVWKSVGLKKCTISIGEDSQICVWNMEGKLLKRLSVHQGGSIWSIACSEQKGLLVTGGSDGCIGTLSLEYCMNNKNPVIPVVFDVDCLDEITEQTIPRRVILLRTGHVVTVLQSGHIMLCCGEESNMQLLCDNCVTEDIAVSEDGDTLFPNVAFVWTCVYFSPKLASYCVLEVSPCRQRFALATLDGQILIFEDCKLDSNLVKIVDFSAVEGKIFSLQWISSSSILTCEALGRLCIWSLHTLEDGSYYLEKTRTLILPHSKERWVTAALYFDNFLICGDRLGSIHLYSLQEKMSENDEPCQSLSKVHGRLGVSFLMLNSNRVYSSGRDGTLRQYQLLKMHSTLKQLCATRMPFDWVSSCCEYANDILVFGFSEKNFVVWTQKQQRLLFEVPCGGGHRSWDCIVKDNIINFVHIKLKCLFIAFCDLKLSIKPFLQTGFHPREVNCLQVLYKNKKFPLLLSGGEDTTIRVTLASSQSKFHTLAVLHSHISSVRALTCCELDEKKILMFSAGGRAQIKAWEFSFEPQCDNETSPKIICQELSSHMLMNSHKQAKSWKLLQPTVDPETRYMSLCIILHNEFVFVAAGCSDGYLRLLHYQEDQQLFQLVGSFEFHHRCILNVACVAPLKVLTMATDGIVAFWDLSVLIPRYMSCYNGGNAVKNNYEETSSDVSKLIPSSHCKLHQSGIDSYDLLALETDHILLATGGDDTALMITAFQFLHNPMSVTKVLQWRMESAHVAQITGLSFVDQHLISTSVDQNVFVWKWFCDVNKRLLFVTKVAEYCTAVADVHGLKAWSDGNSFSLCLYGKGVEIIEEKLIQEDIQ